MKENRKEIIRELEELKSDFLLTEKRRVQNQSENDILPETFYQSVLGNVSPEDSKIISINRLRRFRTLKIAAGFLMLFAAGSFIFHLLNSDYSSSDVNDSNLTNLISQTSYDEIFDYLYDNMDSSEEGVFYEMMNDIEL